MSADPVVARAHRAVVLALVGLVSTSALARAAAEPSEVRPGSSAVAPSFPPAAPLPPIPKLARGEIAAPDPETTKEVDALLSRLTSDKADIREAARDALTRVSPGALGSVHQRLEELRTTIDRERVKAALEQVRRSGREAKRKGKGKGTDREEHDANETKSDDDAADRDDDWLRFALTKPAPKNDAWRDLVHLLGCVRMLSAIGTTPAVRRLIELRGNFGDLLRLDLSRQLDQLGDRAVPALLEARAHDAAVVQRFAAVELDRRGKVTPQEAVGTADPDVLADTLRAFGRLREVDATSILIGFANHDRRKVRDAAREAIGAIGEAGRWRLRDAYQDLCGEKPDKSLGWDLLARRIFHLYDRARFLELEELVARAAALAKDGRHAEATDVFDQVLARDPLVDERAAMAASYATAARTLPRDEDQLAMLRKARLLDPMAADAKQLDAQVAFLEARLMAASGRPDRFLLDRALELDPSHTEAKALREAQRGPAEASLPSSKRPRYAALVGATSLVLAALVAFARRTRPAPAPPTQSAPPAA